MKIVINYEFEGVTYKIVITRKKIKNTYIRVGDNNTILVTTNEIMPENEIIDLVTKNMNKIIKMFNKKTKSVKDNYFLGKKYNVIYGTSDFNIIGDYIYAKDKKTLDKWYDNQIQDIYNKRLKEIYNLFEEKIPFPKLKVRKMKTRWGVCNRYTKTITLNYNLIYYNCMSAGVVERIRLKI